MGLCVCCAPPRTPASSGWCRPPPSRRSDTDTHRRPDRSPRTTGPTCQARIRWLHTPTSKTLAERAAWDFVAEHPEVKLATVNPVGIFGPALGGDTGTSLEIVKRLLGGLPGVPDLAFGVVDVRDVSDLHLLAMTRSEAAGERFLATSGDFMSMLEMARILRTGIGDRARKVPTRVLPNALIRLAGRFDSGMAQLATELGQLKNASGKKAERVLGWMPRSREEALLASAECLLSRRRRGPTPPAGHGPRTAHQKGIS